MSKKRLGTMVIIFLVTIGVFAYHTNNYSLRGATADSGFDAGYDSGGGGGSSWSSGGSSSSWDSGGSSHYSHSGSGGFSTPEGRAAMAVIFIILFVIAGACYLTVVLFDALASRFEVTTVSVPVKSYVHEKLKEYKIDEEQLIKLAYDIYVEIQKAWMDINIDRVKDKLSDVLYNSYKMQLLTLKRNGQKNIMSDFKFKEGYIYDIDDSTDNISISIFLNVNCKDYIIKEEGNILLRGNKNKILDYYYTIDFLISKSPDDVLNKCPNCGAELDQETGSRLICTYCRTLLVRNSPTLIMTRKHMEKQR